MNNASHNVQNDIVQRKTCEVNETNFICSSHGICDVTHILGNFGSRDNLVVSPLLYGNVRMPLVNFLGQTVEFGSYCFRSK